MYKPKTMLPGLTRAAVYAFLLGFLMFTGSQGEAQAHDMRIGLQARQAEVRLQGTVPVRVLAPLADPLAIPAEQVMVFQPRDGGVVVLDTAGNELFKSGGAVQIVPDTTPPAAGTTAPPAPPPTPLISLLGPTRHYDGKADRPYRGIMEIQPRDDGLTVVNILDIESYLWGVVSSEMNPRYPVEALKAQAIAARTYALRNLCRCSRHGYDLDDTPACQVYGGYFSENPRTTQAVSDTAGMVLLYEDKLIDAVYSSTCGGYTESAEEAWGTAVPYLVSVPDACTLDDLQRPHPKDENEWADYFKSEHALNCLQPKYANPQTFRWVKLITRKELEAALPAAYHVGTINNIVPLHRGNSGRITSLRLEGSTTTVVIDKEQNIRRAFGNLRSSAFVVDCYRDDAGVPVVFAFWGGGWGHGLGMCQVGAVGLADQGWTYDKILTYYYHGVTLAKQ